MLPISISIIVPSYNEEEGLEPCIRGVVASLEGVIEDYEIIIINDCSKDRTKEIADQMAKLFPKVRAIHNEVNKGLGYNYQLGYKVAKKDYVILVPGDNELHPDSVKFLAQYAGQKDIIISYPENIHIRPFIRRVASYGFTAIINWISGHKIRYYNGTVLQKRANLLKLGPMTNSFAFQAEILLQMLQDGQTYLEVPFQLNFCSRRMTAFRPRNLISVNYTILRLIFAYRFMPLLGLKSTP